MRLGLLEVWIASGGVRFLEHGTVPSLDCDARPQIITTYIESQSGQAFTVNWKDHVGKDMLCITTRMDGVMVDKHVSPAGTTGCLQGVFSGARLMRLFSFASTADFACLPASNIATSQWGDGLGTIEVTIAPIRAIKNIPASFSGPLCKGLDGLASEHMHCISVDKESFAEGGAIQLNPPIISLAPRVDVELKDEEAVIFKFHYRSLVFLQTLGILPRPVITSVVEGSGIGCPQTHSTASQLGKRSRSMFEDASESPDAYDQLGKRLRSKFDSNVNDKCQSGDSTWYPVCHPSEHMDEGEGAK